MKVINHLKSGLSVQKWPIRLNDKSTTDQMVHSAVMNECSTIRATLKLCCCGSHCKSVVMMHLRKNPNYSGTDKFGGVFGAVCLVVKGKLLIGEILCVAGECSGWAEKKDSKQQ